MNPRMKSTTMLLLLLMFLSAGVTSGSLVFTSPLHYKPQGGFGENSRKLLGLDLVLDYENAGPNVKHDPRGKKGGGGSKTP